MTGLEDSSADKPQNFATGMDTAEYTERLELLYEIAEKASSLPLVSKLLEEILSITQRILKASAASLFLIDPDKQELHVQAAGGEAASLLKQIKLDAKAGIVGSVASTGTPMFVNDVSLDDRFNHDIDEVTGFTTKSILAVPLMRGNKIIAVMEMLNKVDGNPFTEQDLKVLTGLASTEALILLVSMSATAITNIKQSQDVVNGCKDTVETLVMVADARDPYAQGHSQRVKEYAVKAAASLSLSAEEMRAIEFGALLHDIGKIGVNENILLKSEPLTAEEWEVIHEHPIRGAEAIGHIPYLEKSRSIILYHHERYDGSGYPQGLKGQLIPIGARLVAVADAYDSMTTNHSYRTAMTVDQAIAELKKGIRTQFCPVAVDAFIAGMKKNSDDRNAVKAALKEVNAELHKAAQKQEKQNNQPGEKSGLVGDPYDGDIRLVIPPPVHFARVSQFQERLEEIDGLRVAMVGGSADEGAFILVSVKSPIDLEQVITQIPEVQAAQVIEKKGKRRIEITFKDSASGLSG